MTEQEYYAEFMQDIYARAGSENDFCEEKFCEKMCDFLVEQAHIQSYDSAFFKKGQQGIRIDAWSLDKDRQELCLFICDFSPTEEVRTLTQTDANAWFKRAENFFIKAKSCDFYQDIEESLAAYGVARDISENISNISKIRFFLLSNAKRSDRLKGFENRKVDDFNTEYNILDITRLTRLAESGKEKEDIEICFDDYMKGGIPCLPASGETCDCRSFLLVLPGELLANIYDQYGERLLEQNVRTFLQFRAKVNKGIRSTLKNVPEMFFAYNNGLTATAEELHMVSNKIVSVKNLQIVNGGQTTASIFMSKLMDKNAVDLSKVFVQVKLSIINPERVDEVVPLISRYANTQNKVSAADFFSNHPFHRRVEDFSRRILAPSSEGGLTETYWYYERARGQYANQQSKLTTAQRKKFLLQNPNSQMFTKTDLAKFENSFAEMPHYVSKGAQWNFGKFAEEIGGKDDHKGLWDKDENQFNELYFKRLIAKAILFRFLDKNIMSQEWYGGDKANIITYTLALFMKVVREKGRFVNFSDIWQKQRVSEAIQKQLLMMSKLVNETITDTDLNVTQYCKQEICWQRVQKINVFLDKSVLPELVDSLENEYKEKNAKRGQKVLKGIEAQMYVVGRGAKYWGRILTWDEEQRVLTEKDRGLLETASRIPVKLPSEKQCPLIIQIEERALQEGFYIDG